MPELIPPTIESGIITKTSSRAVDAVVARLITLIESKGMKLFIVIDHSGEASLHDLQLRNTKLVIFGSPVAGTPAMQAEPLAALDLPLKVLVWDDEGQTRVTYYDPAALAARRHLSDEVAAPLMGIGALTDALTSF